MNGDLWMSAVLKKLGSEIGMWRRDCCHKVDRDS